MLGAEIARWPILSGTQILPGPRLIKSGERSCCLARVKRGWAHLAYSGQQKSHSDFRSK